MGEWLVEAWSHSSGSRGGVAGLMQTIDNNDYIIVLTEWTVL